MHIKKKLQCIEVVEELRKDVKERKVTIRVEKLKVRCCEVKELKRREVMNNKRDAKWLQTGAYTHTHTKKKPEAEVETGKVKSRTSEEKESFLNSLVSFAAHLTWESLVWVTPRLAFPEPGATAPRRDRTRRGGRASGAGRAGGRGRGASCHATAGSPPW